MQPNEITVKTFWGFFAAGEFEKTSTLFAAASKVYWPCTGEVFNNHDNFIKVNRQYPGKHKITLEKMVSCADTVVTVVLVESVFDDHPAPLFFRATSFFKFAGDRISEINEYWAEVIEPPEWRIKSGLSERYAASR